MKNKPVLSSILKNIATLGFIGYLPLAPGTWGSLAGLICLLSLPLSLPVHLVLIAVGLVVGTIASSAAEKLIGEHDSRHIIIDEFVGVLVATFYLPHSMRFLVAAFLLFRVFDILKPFPVNRVEKTFRGGVGIMADDVVAGIYANAVINIWTIIF